MKGFFVCIPVHLIKRGLIDHNINIELYKSVRLNQGGTAEKIALRPYYWNKWGLRAFLFIKKSIQEFFKKTEQRRLSMFILLFYNWPLRGQEIFVKEQKII